MVGENSIPHVNSKDVEELSPDKWKEVSYDMGKRAIDRFVTSVIVDTAAVEVDGGDVDKTGSEVDTDKDRTDATGEMGDEETLRKTVEELRDRYGNGVNPESVNNLFKLARENPEAFAREFFELQRSYRSEGAEQGYAKAQSEIGKILDGKDIGEFLREQDKLIDELREERDAEKARVAKQVEGLPESERAEAEARLSDERLVDLEMAVEEAEWQYDMIKELQLGNGESGPVTSESDGGEDGTKNGASAEKGETEPRDGFKIEALDPLSEVYDILAQRRRADIVTAVKYFSEDSRDAILKQLAEVEVEEGVAREEAKGKFAAHDGGGSDEDIAAAAAAAGKSSFKETTDEDEKERRRAYREAMSQMADEAKPGRFDKFEEQARVVSKPEEATAENHKWIDNSYYEKLKSWAEDEAKSPVKNRFGDPEIVDKKSKPKKAEKVRTRGGYSADDEYFGKMQTWAEDEQDSLVENRFGDAEETAKGEREKRVGGLWSRLKGRIWRRGSENGGEAGVDAEGATAESGATEEEALAHEPKEKPEYSGLNKVLDELLAEPKQDDAELEIPEVDDAVIEGLRQRKSSIDALAAEITKLDTLGTNKDEFLQGKTFDSPFDEANYLSGLLNTKRDQYMEAWDEYRVELKKILDGKTLEEFLRERGQVMDGLEAALQKEQDKAIEQFYNLPTRERTEERWKLEMKRFDEGIKQISKERWLMEQMDYLQGQA